MLVVLSFDHSTALGVILREEALATQHCETCVFVPVPGPVHSAARGRVETRPIDRSIGFEVVRVKRGLLLWLRRDFLHALVIPNPSVHR